MKRHWYFTYTRACVICGRTDTTRERRYGRKPKTWAKRYEYHETACGSHFL